MMIRMRRKLIRKGHIMGSISLDEKVKTLNEKKALQEEKVKNITTEMEKLRKRLSRENERLSKLNSEIAECEGILYKNELMKHGIKDFGDFKALLERTGNKKFGSEIPVKEKEKTDETKSITT